MIDYERVFNPYTLNIFTDASMNNVNGETIGVPGFVAVNSNDNIPYNVKSSSQVLRQTTNNECELYAIHLAVIEAIYNMDNYRVINIFSDSQFSVFGLREWIFDWKKNIRDGIMYNSSNKPVANQSLFMSIIYNILAYDLHINIYHTRGHFNDNKVDEFIESFTKHNFLNDFIDERLAKEIIKYNNEADHFTRDRVKLLKQKILDTMYPPLLIPQYDADSNINLNRYKKLLNI